MSGSPHIIAGELSTLAGRGIKRAAVAVGVFDGVHAGHRKIVRSLVEMAGNESTPVVLSFHPHPKSVVAPDHAPPLLVSPERRVQLLKESGAKEVVILPFSQALAGLSPNAFLNCVFDNDTPEITGICVGEKWRFGSGAAGDQKTLAAFAATRGIQFRPVEEMMCEGEVISSSRIRNLICSGQLAAAEQLLGHAPELSGTVVHGLNLAGTDLEHPTANLMVEYGVLPPDGVYAARVKFGGECFCGALNIGITPTVRYLGVKDRRIEVHLLNYSGDLYHKNIIVELKQFIREERCFGSLVELKRQIAYDIKAIKSVLGVE